MDVLVLGAGVAGLTSAYILARDGHRVTVIDRRPGVALEGSYATGGQLSYHHAAPIAGPGVIGKLPSWLFGNTSPVRLDVHADWQQIRWLAKFLGACNGRTHDYTTLRLLSMAALSRTIMQGFLQQNETSCDWRQTGKLIVHSSETEFESAKRVAAYKETLGFPLDILTTDECLEREPALKAMMNRMVGGVFAPKEDTADCYKFCRDLHMILDKPPYGVTFMLGTNVTQLVTLGRRVVGANTSQGLVEADAIVLAMGCDSRVLTKPFGYVAPIYPVKGYSLSLPIDDENAAPTMSVTDYRHRIVYARMRGRLRVAGMADIGDRSNNFSQGRLDTLAEHASRSFPQASNFEKLDPWCGLRPTTPNGWPVLGRMPKAENVFLNMGHGMLGFTLAFGSAKITADHVAGRPIDPLFTDLAA